MYKQKGYLTFYALTPIHMGSGQSVSFVDNVVQRERHTSYPTLWSSGIKGVVREFAYRVWNDKDKVNTVFGPEDGSNQYASCISITDARILLFPVRSVKGTFAWITCPFVLKRLKEDLKSIGKIDWPKKNNSEIEITSLPIKQNDKEIQVLIKKDSELKIKSEQVAFEEFVFNAKEEEDIEKIAKYIYDNLLPKTEFDEDFFKNHFAIVSDDVFKDFVNYAVEIRTRIRIDQTTGTVEKGALFTEELIPSESVFYSLVFISEPHFGIDGELYERLKNERESLKQQSQPNYNWDQDIKNKIPNWENSQNPNDKDFAKNLKDLKDKEKRLQDAWNKNYFTDSEVMGKIEKLFNQKSQILQLGGDETLGKGFVKVKFERINTNQ